MSPTKEPNRAPSALQLDLARRIACLIQDGSFAPGQHLTEEGLAEQYTVSRTPVRVALRLLEEQGFVESRANSGVFVAEQASARKLEPPALAAATEDGLYRAIIADHAGGRLDATFSEAELMARYTSAKGLLMRALLKLNQEGLIERRKGHGWRFAPMLDSREALGESYRFRMLLECGGLREPGFRLDLEALRQSRAAHERFAALKAGEQAPGDFFEMNASFHDMLARCSGNRFIELAVRQQNQLRRFEEYATFVTRSVHLVESCQEHLQIMEALERDDRDWAVALLNRHLSMASRL